MTVGTQINFWAQKFLLNWLENDQTGTLVIPSLLFIIENGFIAPVQCDIFFGWQIQYRNDGGHPDWFLSTKNSTLLDIKRPNRNPCNSVSIVYYREWVYCPSVIYFSVGKFSIGNNGYPDWFLNTKFSSQLAQKRPNRNPRNSVSTVYYRGSGLMWDKLLIVLRLCKN
jgi:hypothetical protein